MDVDIEIDLAFKAMEEIRRALEATKISPMLSTRAKNELLKNAWGNATHLVSLLSAAVDATGG